MVRGYPSDHLAPLRRVKVYVLPSALSFMSLQMPTTLPMPSASRRKQPVVVNESILPGVLEVSRMVPP